MKNLQRTNYTGAKRLRESMPLARLRRPLICPPCIHGILLLAFILSLNAAASNYYVAVNGNDANPGSRHRPFATIQKAANVMLPGDTCYVRGGVYRETVKPARSGEKGEPITFKAYRGEHVIVSGADPITNWSRSDGHRYTATPAWNFDQLFVNGLMMNVARWPNAPLDPMRPVWALAKKGTTQSSITDPDIPNVDFSGAQLRILPGRQWISWTRPVKAYNPALHTITFDHPWAAKVAYKLKKGSKFYIFGALSLLDAPGEWYQDNASKVVTLWPPNNANPNTCRVEAKHRDLAFDLSKLSFIHLQGFRIFAATISMAGAHHCEVTECHIRYVSHFTQTGGWSSKVSANSGVIIGGSGNVFRHGSVLYSAGNGVTLRGEDNTLENCVVRYADYAVMDCGAVWAEGRRNRILHCTLSDTARSVLVHRTLKDGRIEYNDMYNAGLLTTDLGITYCFETDGAGTVIAYNWVHDNKAAHVGVGIYIDNGSSNFIIHHNVSWNNSDSGIRLNTPSHHNLVYNNTVLNNGTSVSYWGPNNNKDEAGCKLVNNIFTNKVETGDGIELSHNYSGDDPKLVSIEKRDFRPQKGSPCVDAGVPIKGITPKYHGKAPDIGAYERGQRPWRPGHTWGKPPVF